MELTKIGFIGTGNMATAMIRGLLKSREVPASVIYVTDIDTKKCAVFAAEGLSVAKDALELTSLCDFIVLSVKPQIYSGVLEQIREAVTPDKVLVSIAAGISTAFVKQAVGFDCKVVRAMPNTPLLLGEGATALSKCPRVTDMDFQIVSRIFSASGVVEVLPESLMNEIISVNGTSPAYVYRLAKVVVDGAVAQGIDPEVAKRLFVQTLKGSALMLEQSGSTPTELITMVASPGGTTLAALHAMDETGFDQSVLTAMEACTKRAEELGR